MHARVLGREPAGTQEPPLRLGDPARLQAHTSVFALVKQRAIFSQTIGGVEGSRERQRRDRCGFSGYEGCVVADPSWRLDYWSGFSAVFRGNTHRCVFDFDKVIVLVWLLKRMRFSFGVEKGFCFLKEEAFFHCYFGVLKWRFSLFFFEPVAFLIYFLLIQLSYVIGSSEKNMLLLKCTRTGTTTVYILYVCACTMVLVLVQIYCKNNSFITKLIPSGIEPCTIQQF